LRKKKINRYIGSYEPIFISAKQVAKELGLNYKKVRDTVRKMGIRKACGIFEIRKNKLNDIKSFYLKLWNN
jgi:hypothetical protein